jgi:hypothetical protein
VGAQDPGSRAAGLAMAFKLIESAVNAPQLIALVRADAPSPNGDSSNAPMNTP